MTDGHFRNLAPRVGFAYSLTPKTVIRAGFGIFYAYQTYNSNPQAKNAPFNGSLIVSNAAGEAGLRRRITHLGGLSRGPAGPVSGRRHGLQCVSASRIRIRPPTSGTSTSSARSRATSTLSVAYVAQNGVHILINPNINLPMPGPGAVASRRPYPNLADGTLNCTCANSSFNSFQVTYLNRHFCRTRFPGRLHLRAQHR